VYRHELSQKFDVTVGFPIAGDLLAAATDLTAAELPAGPAVQVEHAGSYETLPAAYAALGAWFGTHRRRPPDVIWEEYLTGPGAAAESEYRTRVVYPVR
jgi:effector-binding domain-containing protein